MLSTKAQGQACVERTTWIEPTRLASVGPDCGSKGREKPVGGLFPHEGAGEVGGQKEMSDGEGLSVSEERAETEKKEKAALS